MDDCVTSVEFQLDFWMSVQCQEYPQVSLQISGSHCHIFSPSPVGCAPGEIHAAALPRPRLASVGRLRRAWPRPLCRRGRRNLPTGHSIHTDASLDPHRRRICWSLPSPSRSSRRRRRLRAPQQRLRAARRQLTRSAAAPGAACSRRLRALVSAVARPPCSRCRVGKNAVLFGRKLCCLGRSSSSTTRRSRSCWSSICPPRPSPPSITTSLQLKIS